jgi:hypothetical protein
MIVSLIREGGGGFSITISAWISAVPAEVLLSHSRKRTTIAPFDCV